MIGGLATTGTATFGASFIGVGGMIGFVGRGGGATGAGPAG
jgi:hypothetical protein